ncbi:MAG: hypothetical protein GY770_02670, partial [Aestuariibacter sp.]|nr:hypothetical protein [Aestuariibacter sp.]
PGQKSNLDLNLRAGKYRLVVLPTELPVRVVTLLKREPSPVSREGHGPFMMDLNEERYTHTWLEPDSGQTRQPDSWTFELPAAAETSLTLSEGMAATLTGLNTETKPQQFSHLKPLKQTLAAGSYRIDAYASRKNNRLDYSLDFKLKELLTGQQRRISAPADIDISIGQTSLIEIGSFGRDDVRAQLFDADGRLLARNDDRSNDWNFNIIRTLPAGRYRLQVNPVGKTQAKTTIQLSEPKALAAKPLNLPAEFTVSKPLIHNYTLDLSTQQGVFAVATQSRDSVSLSLEKRNGNGAWQGIANASGSNALLLAAIDNSVGSGKSYRLKVLSSEQRGAKISVSARLLKTPESPETSLSRGLELISETMLSAEVSASRIQLKSPGMFKVSPQTGSTLFWAGEKDEQLQAYDG